MSPTAIPASPRPSHPGDAGGWWAKKRAVLGSALVLTSPGIPMLFQGQELLEDRWFDDSVALDWDKAVSNKGILRLHRDLIGLRRARDGATLGLRGSNVAILRADQDAKLLAMHRWMDGGPHDDTVVVANFADRTLDRHPARLPGSGPLERPLQLRRVDVRPRLRQPRRLRPGRGRASRSMAASRAGSSRSVRTAW